MRQNCKVHFAGLDNNLTSFISLQTADVRYTLASAYPYLSGKKLGNNLRLPEDHMLKRACRDFKNVILDSGLFTMMFGKDAGKKVTLELLTEWQDKIIAFIKQNDLRVIPVEVDCQKILGPDEAWYLRKRMRKLLPDYRQINVWHFEDGKKGLDELIEFTDYIALSLPEWRKVKGKNCGQQIKYVTHYIRNKKPDIDIHLLGCTDLKLLAENKFCTSADSTSWMYGNIHKIFLDGYKYVKKSTSNPFKSETLKEYEDKAEKLCLEKNIPFQRGPSMEYAAKGGICASICKDAYARICGSQN